MNLSRGPLMSSWSQVIIHEFAKLPSFWVHLDVLRKRRKAYVSFLIPELLQLWKPCCPLRLSRGIHCLPLLTALASAFGMLSFLQYLPHLLFQMEFHMGRFYKWCVDTYPLSHLFFLKPNPKKSHDLSVFGHSQKACYLCSKPVS